MSMPYGPEPAAGQTWRERSRHSREAVVAAADSTTITARWATDARGIRLSTGKTFTRTRDSWARSFEWLSD